MQNKFLCWPICADTQRGFEMFGFTSEDDTYAGSNHFNNQSTHNIPNYVPEIAIGQSTVCSVPQIVD